MQKPYKNLIKTSIFFLLAYYFLIQGVFAETPPQKPQELPQKPDICAEIIFDPTVPEVPITLAESLSIVLNKNFDIRIFLARKDSDRWRYYQTITDWLPDIRYAFILRRIEGAFLIGDIIPARVVETPIESNFILDWNLSLEKYFSLKEAYFVFNSAKENLEFTKDQALLEAARQYYRLLEDKISIDILEINIEQIEEQLRINRQKVKAGIGTKFDVLRAEADLALARQNLIVAKNRYRLSQAQLANILGIPVFIQLVPDDDDVFIKEIFDDCFNLDRAREIAFEYRNDLEASRFNIEAFRQRRNSGLSIYVPELTIFGQLANQGTSSAGLFPSRALGFRIDYLGLTSLGLRGFTEAKARGFELEEAQLEFINATRDVEENLVRAFFNTVAARELIEATDEELESATESRRLSVIRLEAGIGTFIDVLQAQTTFTDARINNLRATIGYNISQIELLFEMGAISVHNILCGFDAGSPVPNYNRSRAEEYNEKIRESTEKQELEEKGEDTKNEER